MTNNNHLLHYYLLIMSWLLYLVLVTH